MDVHATAQLSALQLIITGSGRIIVVLTWTLTRARFKVVVVELPRAWVGVSISIQGTVISYLGVTTQ